MKKFKVLIVVAVLAVGGFFVYQSTQCRLNGSNVCFDSSSQTFKVEEGALLSVHVENQAIADYLQSRWSSLYPTTHLEISVRPVLSIQELSEFPSDIMVVNQNDAAFFVPEFLNMGSNMQALVGSRIPVGLQDAMNLKGFYLAQNSVSGPLFVKNQTLMDSLEITAVDTFEQMFSHKEKILENANSVIPFSFLDQRSFYPFLTAGSWTLNSGHVGTESGYDTEQFLNGLKFIEELSKQKLFANQELKAADLPWNYELDFYSGNALISIIEDRNFAAQHAESKGEKYVYTESPSFNGNRLSPRAEVRGYVVSKKTPFPSAAAEVVRILRSSEVVNLNEFTDEYVPVYHMNHFDELSFDAEQLTLMRAYNFSDAASILGLETDPNILARSVYTEVDIMDILMRLYDGEVDAEGAQKEIVERSALWYAQFVKEES